MAVMMKCDACGKEIELSRTQGGVTGPKTWMTRLFAKSGKWADVCSETCATVVDVENGETPQKMPTASGMVN